MGTHRSGQPGDEPDNDDDRLVLGGALSHPNRHHVTLDNLADLADLVPSPKGDAGGGAAVGVGVDVGVPVDEAAGGGAGGDDGDDGDDESWLSNLAAPADDQPKLKKRRGRSREAKGRRPKGAEPEVPGGDPGPDGAPGTASGPGASGATGASGTGQHPHHVEPDRPGGAYREPGQAQPVSAGQELAILPPAAPPVPAPVPAPTTGQQVVVHAPPSPPATTKGQPGAYSTGQHSAYSTGQHATVTTGEHRAYVVSSARPRVQEAIELPPAPADATPERRRSVWGRVVDRWLLELMAVAVASVAFVTPSVWLSSVVGVCVVGGIISYVASGRPLATLPKRVVRRTVTLLHPRSSLWVPVLAARTVIVSLVLPAAVGALRWTLDEGSEGAVAAARAGAWSHGFRLAVVLVCVMLLTSVGDGRHQRATTVRRWAAPATDGTLVTLAVTCFVVVALAVAAAPHPADPVAAKADGLGWLPPGVRSTADGWRDDIVTTELDSLASCLSSRSETTWAPSYTSGNPLGDADIARLEARREPSQVPPGDLATVIMAAHNQLAPWVELIEVEWPGGDLVRTDRTALPRFEPLTDARLLVAATPTGGQWLSSGSLDRAVGLRCSVAPVL